MISANDKQTVGHVPCILCGERAALSRLAESLWAWSNGILKKRGMPSLAQHEVATCSPECYRLWQRKIGAEAVEREAKLAELKAKRMANENHGQAGKWRDL